jgi:hypothetical protein
MTCLAERTDLFTDVTVAVRDYLAGKCPSAYIKTAYGDIGENVEQVPAIVLSITGIEPDLTRRISGPRRVVNIIPVGESFDAQLRQVPVPINILYRIDTRSPKRYMDLPLAEHIAWILEMPERETFVSAAGRTCYLAREPRPFDAGDMLLSDWWHKIFFCRVPTWLYDPAELVETTGVLQTRILEMNADRHIKQEEG